MNLKVKMKKAHEIRQLAKQIREKEAEDSTVQREGHTWAQDASDGQEGKCCA